MIHPLCTFFISRRTSPPPTSAPFPPSFPARALALAAKGVGHTSCQLDGAPSLRFLTSSKSSSASPAPPLSHVSPPCAARGHAGGQGGHNAPQQQGQQPVGDKRALLANEKRRRRESHNAVERRRRDNIDEKISELAALI